MCDAWLALCDVAYGQEPFNIVTAVTGIELRLPSHLQTAGAGADGAESASLELLDVVRAACLPP